MTIFLFLNRQHTLVYVPSLDKVYSFGSGEGQLGDQPNQLIPLPINFPANIGKSCQGNDHCTMYNDIVQSVFVYSRELFAFVISCLH